MRVKRSWNGPEVRGSKPVTVYFEKWQDKDEILRKTKFLKGTNVFVGEDFSKRVKDQRTELQKFMRLMKKRRPMAKFSLQFDKLLIDKEVYVFNDLTGKIELVNDNLGVYNQARKSKYAKINFIHVAFIKLMPFSNMWG